MVGNLFRKVKFRGAASEAKKSYRAVSLPGRSETGTGVGAAASLSAAVPSQKIVRSFLTTPFLAQRAPGRPEQFGVVWAEKPGCCRSGAFVCAAGSGLFCVGVCAWSLPRAAPISAAPMKMASVVARAIPLILRPPSFRARRSGRARISAIVSAFCRPVYSASPIFSKTHSLLNTSRATDSGIFKALDSSSSRSTRPACSSPTEDLIAMFS